MWFWIMSRSTPDAVVVSAPALDADRFGHRELDLVDVALVPQRLEDAVGEAKRQDVLHRLLAEVVVDAVNLVLRPVGQQFAVQSHRRGQIVAERLLDDDAAPALAGACEAGLFELVRDQAEHHGRRGHVKQDVAAGLILRISWPMRSARRVIGGRSPKLPGV